jgi:hypothetical protein
MPLTRELIGRHGVTFRESIVSLAECCPSRATLLTGRYAHNHGVLASCRGTPACARRGTRASGTSGARSSSTTSGRTRTIWRTSLALPKRRACARRSPFA